MLKIIFKDKMKTTSVQSPSKLLHWSLAFPLSVSDTVDCTGDFLNIIF